MEVLLIQVSRWSDIVREGFTPRNKGREVVTLERILSAQQQVAKALDLLGWVL
jgi:hypothetical protein